MTLLCWKIVWNIGLSFATVVSAWGVPTRKPLHYAATCRAVRDSNDAEVEEQARHKASVVLQAVLVPNSTISTERALKRGLRSIPDGHIRIRRRVSQLVLGTSIFRQRHEYVYNLTHGDENSERTDEARIRSMVDLHAAYLTNSTRVDQDDVPWPSDPVERMSLQHSLPHFLVQAWVDEYGIEEAAALCHVSNHPGPITLRRNALCCPLDEVLVERLQRENSVELAILHPACLRIVSGRPSSIWSMSTWKDGWFEVQDMGSQLIVTSTEVQKEDKVVIDYCAGNGGKTLALISQLHGQNSSAIVWAHDVVDERLAQLKGSIHRAGIANSTVQLYTTSSADEDLQDGMADVVLVDAPCSSSGVLRRRPSHRWELTQQALEVHFPRLQLEILKKASRLVKPGGRLVYATCSICHWENEDVASLWESEVGDSSWDPWPFDADSLPIDHNLPVHYCKLLPHKHDSDGFFIARWKRGKE